MSESFWFMAGEDEESAAPVDHAPFQEPMRGDRKLTNAPSTDQKKVRRQIHRSGSEHVASWGSQWGDDYSPSDWDQDYPKEPDKAHVHRSIKINPSFDLWKKMGRNSGHAPEDVAHQVLDHVRQQPHLGLHWTDDENHAYRVARASNWGQGLSWHKDQDHPEPASDLPAAVIVHAKFPKREHIETDPSVLKRYNVGGYGSDDEYEVPMKTGAPVHITGVSWSQYDTPHKGDFTHHTFADPQHHTATVLNTQVERLNKGDMVRTPTGQSSSVKGIRPHETDSTLMYMDTDQGTSTVKRGTDFQVVPHNSQQQELPDIGNPMNSGNTGQVPGGGHGAGGPVTPGSTGAPAQCPNCGNSGTMRMHSGTYICSVCGFTIAAGGSPGGLLFSNQEHGYAPTRRKPGEVPKAHVWASKYAAQTESQFARHIRQAALGGDK